MTSDEAVVAVIDGLNGLGIPYMVTGSLASNHHGVARSTKDADFVLETGDERLGLLAKNSDPASGLSRRCLSRRSRERPVRSFEWSMPRSALN